LETPLLLIGGGGLDIPLEFGDLVLFMGLGVGGCGVCCSSSPPKSPGGGGGSGAYEFGSSSLEFDCVIGGGGRIVVAGCDAFRLTTGGGGMWASSFGIGGGGVDVFSGSSYLT